MAQVTVKKWGNSPSVRLPVAIMQKAALRVDDTVEIAVEEGRIIITPVKAIEYSLDNLLAGITQENIHEKADFGARAGEELI
ncbi:MULTISPECIES: AbrB/MazE/SpoVT family DNA-binding domain-containing protein [Morganellaceae]|uniref:AbrB/MazE/SpoVT family DNA-binding domain-containing protein n=1 Tax=Morganellaceae TaxID=1903414 RepID=UPI001071B9ED|nr:MULTISPECIES: AbrB/MazE/SpoVT family DNA-binding domain-containing protein [Morganellaceae]ELB3894099.1 AbrB/MazE/SpoVT family DNA-binding domain-containing protein [Morganella morganii]ELB3894651.1 AbrB/MazE/SpoVT family DNA-binding domain-containing protein [Morganella morganii]ELR5110451.1 AbrB/MazE/SpoVT family DNA-binding domain-containing protein [Providencia rettgeri]ELU1438518.1 AbrB/MazE/SpoVT family DNA-binding domain-containing protein [Providencia rettgeri]ELU1439676.1 AbrB/MazE